MAQLNGQVRTWSRRVLSAADLRQGLAGCREIVVPAGAIVTPLAGEEMRSAGIHLTVESAPRTAAGPVWGYGQDRPHPLVRAAVQAISRDGRALRELPGVGSDLPCRWARAIAGSIASGECVGGVLFCEDPGLVACVANKVSGLRAVAVCTVGQAARATLSLAANLLVVEMPGRTFFEIRQILNLSTVRATPCPDGVACTLGELDGHAHR